MLRYQRGTKTPDTKGLRLRYVEFTIPEGSNWSGVRLNLAWRDGPPAGMFSGGDISVEVTFTVNKGIRRCMAKYSFNFLAFVCGPALGAC
jgi:hypothetical protein